MRFPCVWVALVFVAVGCQIDEGGVGTTTTELPSTSGGSTVTSEGDDTVSTGHATDSGSGEATASSGTAGSDTDPGSGTAGSSTGPVEGSSTSVGETGDLPNAGEPYGPCDREDECTGDGVICWQEFGFEMCLPPCPTGMNPSCPEAPPDNDALVECIEVRGTHCMLNCAAGGKDTCPAGTTCEEIFTDVFRCLWS
jgi:hypothetical protein